MHISEHATNVLQLMYVLSINRSGHFSDNWLAPTNVEPLWLVYQAKPEYHCMKTRQVAPKQQPDQWWGNIARIPLYMDFPTALLLVIQQIIIEENRTNNATFVSDKANHRLERLFWIIVISSGFFCASLLLWDAFEDWVENPTGTNSTQQVFV